MINFASMTSREVVVFAGDQIGLFNYKLDEVN